MTRKARAAEETANTAPASRKNREVMKAVIFGGQEVNKSLDQSNQLDAFDGQYKIGGMVEPPFDLLTLSMMSENSTELGQCVDAMVTNIEGFGGRLDLKIKDKAVEEKNQAEIAREKKELRRFLLSVNPVEDLTSLRKKARNDLEKTGNAYWELIPTKGDPNKITAINYVASHTIRIVRPDKNVKVTKTFLDPETGETFEKVFYQNFYKYVQMRNNKKVYFKQWGDPRFMDCTTGTSYATLAAATKAGVPEVNLATPLYHFSIFTARSPYGLPRYIGNLFSVFGSRAADEINYNTFLNNCIPASVIMVSGNAMLTEGTIRRIKEFTENITKRTANYSKILLLEAEPATEALQNSSTAKIEIKPMTDNQHGDQLFQAYDKNNADKLRRAFRLPPLYVGKAEDYNKATAEASRRLAEEQVFGPERTEMDRKITMLFQDMGYHFWCFKSYSPLVTDPEALVSMLNLSEKTGAITPNLARQVVGDILGQEVPLYEKGKVPFDPDVPFSLAMAEAVKGEQGLGGNGSTGKGALAPNQNQIASTKEQVEKAKTEPTAAEKVIDVHGQLDKLLSDAVNLGDISGHGKESSAF